MFLATKAFWAGTAERAIKTFAQAGLAVLGATAVNLWTVDWTADLGIAGGAALLSVLTSLATGTTVTATSPATPAAPAVTVTPTSLAAFQASVSQAGTTTTAGADPASGTTTGGTQ